MRVGHRLDATIEGAQEFAHRGVTITRALRNGDHRGEYVLDAVIELGNLRFCPFDFLALRNIPSDRVNRYGLARCVRDQLRIHFKYPLRADLCEYLNLVLGARLPLELSIQHFDVCAELLLRYLVSKRLPNHLCRRKAHDTFDRWLNLSEPQIQTHCTDDTSRLLD